MFYKKTFILLKKHIQTRLELAIALALKSVKIRYKNSVLGYIWSMLTPLVYLAIFVVIFSGRLNIENYALYALSGLIFWNFFQTTVNQLIVSVTSSAGVLKSINVPTLIFPISAISSSLINLGLSLIPFFGLMFFFGFEPSLRSLQVIYILLMFSCFTLGLGLLLCAYNVYFRDVGMLWTTITPALFYSTPLVWHIDMLGKYSKKWYAAQCNPIYQYINAFRTALYDNEWMTLEQFGIITGLGLVVLLIGYTTFVRLEKGFYSHY